MNPQTNTTTENTVPQWAKDAGSEIYRKGLRDTEEITQIIVEYACLPATPAQTPQASIWRPVSVKAEPKINGRGICRFKNGAMNTFSTYYFEPTPESAITHWCYLSDLLALAPLPTENMQEEKDAEAFAKWNNGGGGFSESAARHGYQEPLELCWKAAIAYGRATATTATGGRA